MKPYYEDDGVTIWHGDCREIMPLLTADVVVSDPPYGTGWVRGGGNDPHGGPHPFNAAHEQPAWDVFDVEWMKLAPVSRFAIFCPVSRQFEVAQAIGAPAILYYRKTNPRPLGPSREAIVVKPAPWDMGCWEFSAYNAEARLHPCQKPTQLMAWLVSGVTCGHDIVLDPFMGSGTTLLSAKQMGRKAIGIEISEEYCEVAVQRLNQESFDFSLSLENGSVQRPKTQTPLVWPTQAAEE